MKRLVAAVLVASAWCSTSPAAADTPLDLRTRWACSPASVWVDPASPAPVLAAVAEWHRVFRPDWTFTTDRAAATVVVAMLHPPIAGADGEAVMTGDATTRFRADVYVDPAALDYVAGRIARHELGHVGGLEHSTSQWDAMGAYTLVDRYSANELAMLAVARRLCVR